MAQAAAEQLIQTGRIERGYLGVRLQDLTDSIAQAMGLRNSKGALVASVEPGSPAEKADIRSSDLIVRSNGQPVESARDLARSVAGLKPGTSATISVMRMAVRSN